MPTPKRKMTLTANGHQSWGSRTRDRIDSGKIVDRLQRVAEGKEEATMVEITAARMLLDRTLPTIAAIQIPLGDGGNAKTITNDQLLSIIEGKSKRIA